MVMMGEDKIAVSVTCVKCNKDIVLTGTPSQWSRYRSGAEHIQVIFPEMSSALREMLISRICPECWDKMFAEEV